MNLNRARDFKSIPSNGGHVLYKTSELYAETSRILYNTASVR